MTVRMILAVSRNLMLGRRGHLPWRMRTDLQRFRQLTSWHPCIVGRKTMQSLGRRGLPGRRLIVVSSRTTDLPAALTLCPEPWIIGGRQLYETAFAQGLVDEVHLTVVDAVVNGDVALPAGFLRGWHVRSREYFPRAAGDDYGHWYAICRKD